MLTIKEDDLNRIMDALMRAQNALTPTNNDEEIKAREALIVAQSVIVSAKDGKADAALRAAAEHRVMWHFRATDEIEIDDEASASHGDEGSWVSAWVWVPRAEDADLEEAADGDICTACERDSLDCSREPCAAVIADRAA